MNEAAILKQFHEYCPVYSSFQLQGNISIPTEYSADLTVFGHNFHVPTIIAGRRVAAFTFQDICNRAYGAADFIALAKVFHVICVTNVPQMSIKGRDEVMSLVIVFIVLFCYVFICR